MLYVWIYKICFNYLNIVDKILSILHKENTVSIPLTLSYLNILICKYINSYVYYCDIENE